MKETVYDLIILGAGPAGLTAGIYARRARLKTLILEKNFTGGGQIVSTDQVDNYPGMPKISGYELAEAFVNHAHALGLEITQAKITSIETDAQTGEKVIRTKKGNFRGKALLFACGAGHRHLGVPGEEELAGMGVSYCATCDGAFFKDRTVAVVGGGNSAVEEALFLSRLCAKVFLIHRRETLRADPVLWEPLEKAENIEMLYNTTVSRITGEEQVEKLVLCKQGRGEYEQKVDGVFLAVGMEPNTQLAQGLVNLDENGYIVAGEDGKTSVPGIFAAGDIRTKRVRQILTAAADGAAVIASVSDYLLQDCTISTNSIEN